MTNYKLIIRYDGTRYKGWEHQPGEELTIQGKLESAVIRMLNPSGFSDEAGDDSHPVLKPDNLGSFEGDIPEIISAGRTDAGVHALAMPANVKLDTSLDCIQIRDSLNRNLPDDICVISVEKVHDRFHARYNACGKTYRYTCYAGDLKPVFDRRYCYVLGSIPDVEKMREAAGHLIGEHDFSSFCGNTRMKKSCVRTVDSVEIDLKDGMLTLEYHGNGFLQYMVRILTGTLLEVGLGKRDAASIPALIEAKDRSLSGFTAPARGLCLVEVDYKE